MLVHALLAKYSLVDKNVQHSLLCLTSCLLSKCILGLLTHTTVWEQLWAGNETEILVLKLQISKL